MQYSVIKEFTFEAGHRVLGHAGKCQYLHGHSYKGHVRVSADRLDHLGMVVDFADVGAAIKPLVAQWDHTLILADADPFADLLEREGQEVRRLAGNATVEIMARVLFDKLSQRLDSMALWVEEVVLWETATACAVVTRPAGAGHAAR